MRLATAAPVFSAGIKPDFWRAYTIRRYHFLTTSLGDTFAGVSPRSAGMAQVARLIGQLPTASDQVQGVDYLLSESYQLPPG